MIQYIVMPTTDVHDGSLYQGQLTILRLSQDCHIHIQQVVQLRAAKGTVWGGSWTIIDTQ